jgi:glutathione S-transferase
MPWLFLKLVFTRLGPSSPWAVRPLVNGIAKTIQKQFVDPQVRTHLDYWEAELGKSDWLAGPDFSAADIQMSFPIEGAAQRAFRKEERPVLSKYLDRIHARPAYQRALERGGPYDYA